MELVSIWHSEGMSRSLSVGPHLATRWYCLGLRTLDDVAKEKFGIKLTAAQKVYAHPNDLYRADLTVSCRLASNTMMVCMRGRCSLPQMLKASQDLRTRMPREEAKAIYEKVTKIGQPFS